MKRIRLVDPEVVEKIADKYISAKGGKPKPKAEKKPKKALSEPKVTVVAEEPEPEKKRGRGRPTTYDPKYVKIAKLLCARGATNAVLADAFNVHTDSITQWQATHEEFAKAMAEGKAEIFDPMVERSLAQRALGYAVDTEEVKITKDGDEVRYQIRKQYPPDTTACIFWLKNRQPERWKDVHETKHSGKVELESKSAEELWDEIQKEVVALGLAPGQIEGLVPNGKGSKH